MTHAPAHRGFSLAEVMLAMFILGIGIVAVASIFPAGIAQQRQAADDILGPIVAENALAVLRSKVRPEDFGTFEEHGATPEFSSTAAIPATVPGDWPWRRPGFYLRPRTIGLPNGDQIAVRPGSISVFENTSEPGDAASEVPWSSALHGLASGPLVIVNQRERYYPMQPESAAAGTRPEYVWDCMFRRFQGRILVAIFVYRVSLASGGGVSWAVPPNYSNTSVPPLPVDLELTQWWNATGGSFTDPRDDGVIPGTGPGDAYDPATDPSWQFPGQWMLDQNNNIIRVLSGRRSEDEGPVELVRPVPAIPTLPLAPPSGPYLGSPFFYSSTSPNPGVVGVVNRIWYLPAEVSLDVDGDMSADTVELRVTLTPVFIGVREL
jgi:prepilin-type N-terminal cleavage/methylation domain-containing protein